MSSINVSRANVDIRHLSGRGSGTSDIIFSLRENLLKNTEDYCVGIEQLTIPLSHTRVLGTAEPTLFYIRRRNVGVDITTAANTEITAANAQIPANFRAALAPNAQFTTTRLPLHSMSDLLLSLTTFAASFSRVVQDVHGITAANTASGKNGKRLFCGASIPCGDTA